MRKRKVFYYTLCIWLTPVAVAPLFFILFYQLNSPHLFSQYMLLLAVGFLFSFPIWYLLFKVTGWIQQAEPSPLRQRFYIIVSGLLLALLCVLILVHEENPLHFSLLQYYLPYAGVFLLSALFFPYPAPLPDISPVHLKGRHIRIRLNDHEPPLAGVILSDGNVTNMTVRLHRHINGQQLSSDLLELRLLDEDQAFASLLYHHRVMVDGYLLQDAEQEYFCTGHAELDYTLN
ncbi:hypothetical protein ACWKWU_11430 [Chitinophaga lutea]